MPNRANLSDEMSPEQEDALAGRRVRGRSRRGEGNGGGEEGRRGDADGAARSGAAAEFFEVSLSPPLAKLSEANRLFVTHHLAGAIE